LKITKKKQSCQVNRSQSGFQSSTPLTKSKMDLAYLSKWRKLV